MESKKRFVFFFIFSLCGCEAGLEFSNSDDVERLYTRARASLENERYSEAFPIYRQLISMSDGETRQKLQLEYCHGLLRSDRLETAIICSNRVIQSNDRAFSKSALEIKLTAEHERYLVFASSNQENGIANELRLSLLQTLDQILSKYKISEMDPEVQFRIARIQKI